MTECCVFSVEAGIVLASHSFQLGPKVAQVGYYMHMCIIFLSFLVLHFLIAQNFKKNAMDIACKS
jgi:hypothetical protein